MDAVPERAPARGSPSIPSAFAPFVATNPAAIVIVDAAGIIVYANHAPDGSPASTVAGKSLFTILGADTAEGLRASFARVSGDQTPASFEIGDTSPGRTRAWWRVEANPIEGGGATFVFTDATEDRRERDRLRRSESILVDAQGVAHLGTWEWDISEPHAAWSDELYRIYGLTPEEYTPSYDGYLKMVHPDDRERVMRVTEACFKEHTPYSHDERIFRPDGEMRWLHTWALPILNSEGELERLLGVCQDITEQKRAESAMRAQMMTRSLARRLLHDLIRRAHVPDPIVRDLGRGLAAERVGENGHIASYVAAFGDMGFGALKLDDESERRYSFSGTDLLERRPTTPLPTCFLTLGYLEGIISSLTGRTALGNEMRCQSMGHPECKFVVMTQ